MSTEEKKWIYLDHDSADVALELNLPGSSVKMIETSEPAGPDDKYYLIERQEVWIKNNEFDNEFDRPVFGTTRVRPATEAEIAQIKEAEKLGSILTEAYEAVFRG